LIVIFVIFHVVTLLLVSWLYYKENLNTLQVAGVLLGLLSITILEIAE